MDYDFFCGYVLKKKGEGYIKVILCGGEPFMHPEIMKFIDFIHSQNLKCTVITNGTLITESVAERLKDRVELIALSLYEADPILGDSISGMIGSTKKRLDTLRILYEKKIPTLINGAIFRDNYKSMLNTVKKVLEINPDLINFSFIYYRVSDSQLGNRKLPFRLLVPYSESAKYLMELFSYLESRKVEFTISEVPLCFLGKFYKASRNMVSHPDYEQSYDYLLEMRDQVFAFEYVKTSACDGCKLSDSCGGISKYYYELLGDNEIKPL